jgi:hypothetical protein
MKFYLMAGGLLIMTASVYGVIDYIRTKNKKAFKDLYKEAPAVKSTVVKLSDVKEEDYSRGKLESSAPPPAKPKPAVAAKPTETKVKMKMKTSAYAAEKTNDDFTPVTAEVKVEAPKPVAKIAPAPTAKKKLKKKINMKMYSRAAPVREIRVVEEKKN